MTGGGSVKYKDFIEVHNPPHPQKELGVKGVQVDEMKSLCVGIGVLSSQLPGQFYHFDRKLGPIGIEKVIFGCNV